MKEYARNLEAWTETADGVATIRLRVGPGCLRFRHCRQVNQRQMAASLDRLCSGLDNMLMLGREEPFGFLERNGNDNQGTAAFGFDIKGAT
jgi:hypothetical protein